MISHALQVNELWISFIFLISILQMKVGLVSWRRLYENLEKSVPESKKFSCTEYHLKETQTSAC